MSTDTDVDTDTGPAELTWASGDSGCEIPGLAFDSPGNQLDKSGKPEAGFTLDGIGFSYHCSSYSKVMVYASPSYGGCHPSAHGTFDETDNNVPESWHLRAYDLCRGPL